MFMAVAVGLTASGLGVRGGGMGGEAECLSTSRSSVGGKVTGGSWASDWRVGWGDVAPWRRRWSRVTSLGRRSVKLSRWSRWSAIQMALWLVDRGTVLLFGVAVGGWGGKVLRLTVVSGGSAEIGDDLQLQIEGGGRQQVLYEAC